MSKYQPEGVSEKQFNTERRQFGFGLGFLMGFQKVPLLSRTMTERQGNIDLLISNLFPNNSDMFPLVHVPGTWETRNIAASSAPYINNDQRLYPAEKAHDSGNPHENRLREQFDQKLFGLLMRKFINLAYGSSRYVNYLHGIVYPGLADEWLRAQKHFPVSGNAVNLPDAGYLREMYDFMRVVTERTPAGERARARENKTPARESIARQLQKVKYSTGTMSDRYNQLRRVLARQDMKPDQLSRYVAETYGVAMEFPQPVSAMALAIEILEKQQASDLLIEQREQIEKFAKDLLIARFPQCAERIARVKLRYYNTLTWNKHYQPGSPEHTILEPIMSSGGDMGGFATDPLDSDFVFVNVNSGDVSIIVYETIHEIAHRLPPMTPSPDNDPSHYFVGSSCPRDGSQSYSTANEGQTFRIQVGIFPERFTGGDADNYTSSAIAYERLDKVLASVGQATSLQLHLQSTPFMLPGIIDQVAGIENYGDELMAAIESHEFEKAFRMIRRMQDSIKRS